MYHPSLLSPQAQERTIQATQTSGVRRPAVTHDEIAWLETFVMARLNLAVFHRAPAIRMRELQKQLLIVKNLKVGM